MANVLFYNDPDTIVNTPGTAEAGTNVRFNSSGYAEVLGTATSLIQAVQEQGAVRVDKEGTEEALTAGTVQTATTCSALSIRNGAASTVLEVRNLNASGALLVGPITIAANAERVIIFPTALVAAGGVFVRAVSGGLNATPGFLIP